MLMIFIQEIKVSSDTQSSDDHMLLIWKLVFGFGGASGWFWIKLQIWHNFSTGVNASSKKPFLNGFWYDDIKSGS